ncbi:MAG: hypothetical protein ACRYG7_23075 [Janthinobacterium lividum]
MLLPVCPLLVAAPLAASYCRHPRTAAGRSRAQRWAAWGSFRQRSIDRRYGGLPFIGGAAWFSLACRLAGGRPSAHCWQPFGPAPVAPTAKCLCCQSAREEATSRCACYA